MIGVLGWWMAEEGDSNSMQVLSFSEAASLGYDEIMEGSEFQCERAHSACTSSSIHVTFVALTHKPALFEACVECVAPRNRVCCCC